MLKLFGVSVFRATLRNSDYRAVTNFPLDLRQVLYECYDLSIRGLIASEQIAIGPTDIIPNRMETQGLGADMFNFMALGSIPDTDLRQLAKQLQ